MWTPLSVLLLASLVPAGPQDHLRAHRAADASLVAGRLDAARTAFERCLVESPANPTLAYGLACTEARAGNVEQAFEWLEQAAAWGYPDYAVAAWDEDLATLRDDPRFPAMVQAIRANAEPLRRSVHVERGETVRIYAPEEVAYSTCTAVDPAGEVAAVGDNDGRVVLLEARSGRELRRWAELESPVWALAFHPGGRHLAALTWDGRLHLGPVDGGAAPIHRRALPLAGGEQAGDWPFGAQVQFDAGGERILVGARRRGASLWRSDGQALQAWPASSGASFGVELAWSPDGCSIAVPGHVLDERAGNEVRFLDLGTGDPVRPTLVTPSRVECVAFLPDGWRLATGHEDGSLRLWDLPTAGLLDWFEVIGAPFSPAPVNAMCFSPDGSRVGVAWGQDPGSGAWSAHVLLLELASHGLIGSSARQGRVIAPFELHWLPDSRHLVFGFANEMKVCVAVEGALGRNVLVQGRPATAGANGLTVVTDSWSEQGFDVPTGKVLWMRPRLGRDVELRHVPEGYFACDHGRLERLLVLPPGRDAEPIALPDLVETLFDPKRVRAAQAGVWIVEPAL